MNRRKVPISQLVPMDVFPEFAGGGIDLVYADENHPENIFGRIYRPGCRLWMFEDLAAVTVLAARLCARRARGTRLRLKDCLRPVEAQALMQQAEIVRCNPHWCEEPNRLLSPPGAGAHPRAMAVDAVPVDEAGAPLEMGTGFDFLSEDPDNNPAARSFTDLPQKALNNRRLLEDSFAGAAALLGLEFLPLPAEWWDFRFPPEITNAFAPLSDADLPGQMRMTEVCPCVPAAPDFPERHFEDLRDRIGDRVSRFEADRR